MKCVCYSKSFESLKQIAEDNQVESVEELQQHVAFGFGCRTCIPYVRAMLETGATDYAELEQHVE